MSRGSVPPLQPSNTGRCGDGDAPPPLWDVGWTVEVPILYTAEGPHPCGDAPRMMSPPRPFGQCINTDALPPLWEVHMA